MWVYMSDDPTKPVRFNILESDPKGNVVVDFAKERHIAESKAIDHAKKTGKVCFIRDGAIEGDNIVASVDPSGVIRTTPPFRG